MNFLVFTLSVCLVVALWSGSGGYVGIITLAEGKLATRSPAQFEDESRTLALLHDDNFEEWAQSKANLVVGFYAPWCPYCVEWAKEFTAAAKELNNLGVFAAKVDAYSTNPPSAEENIGNHTVVEPFRPGTATAEKFRVTSFPSLRLLHYGRWNEEVKLPRGGEQLVEYMRTWARPSSIPLYTVEEVENAVRENRRKFTVAIGFYEDPLTGTTFGELGHHFKELILFYHIAGRDYSMGARDPGKQAIFEHFHVKNTFVIFKHESDPERRIFGHNPVQQSSTGAASSPATSTLPNGTAIPPIDAESAAAHEVLAKLNPNHVLQRDFVRSPGHPDLAHWGMYTARKAGDPAERDEVINFISTHGLSPVGFLTSKNRQVYNQRSKGLVFLFLPLDTRPFDSAASGEVSTMEDSPKATATESASAEGENSADPDAPQSIVLPPKAGKGQAPPHKAVQLVERCTTEMHPENGPMKKCQFVPKEEEEGGGSQAGKGGASKPKNKRTKRTKGGSGFGKVGGDSGATENDEDAAKRLPLSPAEVQRLGDSILSVARKSLFRNFSFLLVHPMEVPQIFRTFGFSEEDLQPFSLKSDLMGSSMLTESEMKDIPLPERRTNLIGVTMGRNKYRYPYRYYSAVLMEKFLEDLEAGLLTPYIQSLNAPLEKTQIGSGMPIVLVFDNFEALVKRDLETDAFILFGNPYESLTRLVANTFISIADGEKGNSHLLIGVFDAMHNDSPKGFQYDSLPTIYFIPSRMKREITFNAPKAKTLNERINPENEDYEKHSEGFKPRVYQGDFSHRSIHVWLSHQVSSPLRTPPEKEEVVYKPDPQREREAAGAGQESATKEDAEEIALRKLKEAAAADGQGQPVGGGSPPKTGKTSAASSTKFVRKVGKDGSVEFVRETELN
jgi:thiol-disulfide isomerase/thioredoxin